MKEKVGGSHINCLIFFQNGVPAHNVSYTMDVDFMSDYLQEYSCSVSPVEWGRDHMLRTVDLGLRTIHGMCLP